MDAKFWSRRTLLGCGVVWLGISAWSTGANAVPDFSDVSDVDLLLHEDREQAMEEYKRRAKDYTPQQVREIEAEYFRLIRMPREKVEPTVNDLLGKVNQSDDAVERMKSFTLLQEQYMAAEDIEKESIRQAFMAAWTEIPYPSTYEEDKNDNMMRYRDYAYQAGLYFTREDELLPILEERCLKIDTADRMGLFVSELARARITLGPIAAKRAENLFQELILSGENSILTCGESTLNDLLIRTLGRCGKPGLDALLRLGKETSEEGIWALGFNSSPESESKLWEMFASTPEGSVRTRLNILRALYAKLGTPEEQIARRDRLRPELVHYVKLPEGVADIWNIQAAVELAKDTKDPYYLPHVEALERAFFNLNSNAYTCSGMEDRMVEALATLRERFDEAKTTLADADVVARE